MKSIKPPKLIGKSSKMYQHLLEMTLPMSMGLKLLQDNYPSSINLEIVP